MKLIKCKPSDLEDIIKIGRQTYFETFHSMNTEETMTKYLEEAFSNEKIEDELEILNSFFYLLSENDLVLGYIKINFPPAQSDLNDPESMELERIYVKKDFKGQGYGKVLMEKAISLAVENCSSYIWLGVWKKNEAALAFYKKMGFEIFGKHSFQMGDEIQFDYMLKKNISLNKDL